MSPACPVFGFRVEIHAPDAIRDDLERELVAIAHARGLIVDRVYDGHLRVFILRSEAGQANDLDRHAVLEWAATRAEARASVGLLEDVGTLA